MASMKIMVVQLNQIGSIMTNLLAGIKQADAVEEVKDNLGGSKFSPVDSGIYEATIKYAYLKPSAGGALGLHMELDLDNGSTVRESIYLTKRTGENYYVDKNDASKKHLLPGYITADAIALLGAQKPIAELKTEDKIIKLYDSAQQAEVPTTVPMLTALTGKTIKAGIVKIVEDKQVKSDSGAYVKGEGVRTKNEIDKVFHPTNNMTVPELRAGATEAEFYDAWKAKWDGKVDDKSTGGGTAASAKAKPAVSSLFK